MHHTSKFCSPPESPATALSMPVPASTGPGVNSHLDCMGRPLSVGDTVEFIDGSTGLVYVLLPAGRFSYGFNCAFASTVSRLVCGGQA